MIDLWFSVCLIVVIQVAVITLVAMILASRFSWQCSSHHYSIWFSAVVLVLLLAPIHIAIGGRPVYLLSFADAVASPPVSASAPDASGNFIASPQEARQDLTSPVVVSEQPMQEELLNHHSTDQLQAHAFATNQFFVSKPSIARWMLRSAAACYVLGCFAALARLVIGAVQLVSWFRCGRSLSEAAHKSLSQAANDVGLGNAPPTRLVDQIAMPLVFGLFRPVVLLPATFELWSDDEQRASLLHELTHIRRHDMVGLVLTQSMRVIYWFHPACWLLNRRLTESREWATDQQVVNGPMDAERYANSLLNIVARAGLKPNVSTICGTAVLAMSSSNELEGRLNRILQHTPMRSFWRNLVGPCSVGVLMLITALTTVRLDEAVAQDKPVQDKPVQDKDVQTSEPVSAAKSKVVVSNQDDFFVRIRDCDVLTVTGDAFSTSYTVAGQVVTPEGVPVAGAIVLLRESSSRRLMSDESLLRSFKDMPIPRIDDVLARTTTDVNGKFQFRDVKSPTIANRKLSSWPTDIVAAHEQLGMGWVTISSESQKRTVIADMQVKLQPTRTVSGRFVSPDKLPIADATIRLNHLIKAADGRGPRQELGLPASQLSLTVKTDNEGNFFLTNLPQGCAVFAATRHPDWCSSAAKLIATGDGPGDANLLIVEPREVVADPGIFIDGDVVDPNGEPLADARVSYHAQTVRTDQTGKFRLRIPMEEIDHAFQRSSKSMELTIAAAHTTGLLPHWQQVSWDDLKELQAIHVQLKQGVLVTGNVIDEDGKPLAGASVRSTEATTRSSAKTGDDGRYELTLPMAKQVMLFSLDKPGYQLPTWRDVSDVIGGIPASWPKHAIDLTAGTTQEVPPIVVAKIKPLHVVVSLPDGRPASGAMVVIKDVFKAFAIWQDQTAPTPLDRSQPVSADPFGKADLIPLGILSEKAFVELALVKDGRAFNATVSLDRARDNVLSVVMNEAWIIEGRVLIDGQPLAGAKLLVGETVAAPITRNGITATALTTSNHQVAITDADGWYRTAVRPDKEYTVSVQSLPEGVSGIPLGYRASQAVDGHARVQDFALSRHHHEIAGRVIDLQGNAIPGCQVYVLRDKVEPDLWVGYRDQSQMKTDDTGRFHLKHIPAGIFQLSVHGPRTADGRPGPTTRVSAAAGQTDVVVTLDARPLPAIPRLQPRKIKPVESP